MEKNQQIIRGRVDGEIPREFSEDMIYLSLIPLQGIYDTDKLQEIFSECMAAYDFNIGCTYALFENNKPMAYAFVFDKYDSADGAPHLHTFSVNPSNIRKGYGSTLLANILLAEKSYGLTLECAESSKKFFAKNGFEVREKSLDNQHFSMFSEKAEDSPRFKLPQLNAKAIDTYGDLYSNCLKRLISKGQVRA